MDTQRKEAASMANPSISDSKLLLSVADISKAAMSMKSCRARMLPKGWRNLDFHNNKIYIFH